MKKKLALLLALILTVSACLLTSCGDTPTSPDDQTDPSAASTSSTVPDSSDSSTADSSTAAPTQNGTTAAPTSGNAGGKTTAAKTTAGTKTTKADTVKTQGVDKFRGSTVKLLLWYKPSANEQATLNQFIKDTGINVKVVRTSGSQYLQKASSMIASNDSPDLVKMEGQHFPMMITKNIVQTIDKGNFNLNDSAYAKEVMDLFKWGGKYYGVNVKGSTFTDMYMIFYNKTMFDNRGVKSPEKLWQQGQWNWNTFLQTAQQMTYTANGKKVYGFCSYAPMAWMLSAGVDFVSISGSTIRNTMNDAKVLDAWKFACNLRTKYGVDMAKDDCEDQEFINREVAMLGAGQFFAWKGMNIDTQLTDKWGAVPWPCPKGQEYILPVGGIVWCLGSGAKNPEAAAHFIRYWLDPKNAQGQQLAQTSMQSTLDFMWNAKKHSLMSKGILNFGGSNNYSTISKELANSTEENVATKLASWSKKMDGYISSVVNEIPKK